MYAYMPNIPQKYTNCINELCLEEAMIYLNGGVSGYLDIVKWCPHSPVSLDFRKFDLICMVWT